MSPPLDIEENRAKESLFSQGTTTGQLLWPALVVVSLLAAIALAAYSLGEVFSEEGPPSALVKSSPVIMQMSGVKLSEFEGAEAWSTSRIGSLKVLPKRHGLFTVGSFSEAYFDGVFHEDRLRANQPLKSGISGISSFFADRRPVTPGVRKQAFFAGTDRVSEIHLKNLEWKIYRDEVLVMSLNAEQGFKKSGDPKTQLGKVQVAFPQSKKHLRKLAMSWDDQRLGFIIPGAPSRALPHRKPKVHYNFVSLESLL